LPFKRRLALHFKYLIKYSLAQILHFGVFQNEVQHTGADVASDWLCDALVYTFSHVSLLYCAPKDAKLYSRAQSLKCGHGFDNVAD
jgi:hypothetical protein